MIDNNQDSLTKTLNDKGSISYIGENQGFMEKTCGKRHVTVEDALDHAFKGVGKPLTRQLIGTKTNKLANVGKVIGFQTPDGKTRVRLDFDPVKGLHVNEEDYTKPAALQKVVHVVEKVATGQNEAAEQMLSNWQENRLLLFWNKWTKRF